MTAADAVVVVAAAVGTDKIAAAVLDRPAVRSRNIVVGSHSVAVAAAVGVVEAVAAAAAVVEAVAAAVVVEAVAVVADRLGFAFYFSYLFSPQTKSITSGVGRFN